MINSLIAYLPRPSNSFRHCYTSEIVIKIKSYNINSNIIEWTKHYLSNRTQYVELN